MELHSQWNGHTHFNAQEQKKTKPERKKNQTNIKSILQIFTSIAPINHHFFSNESAKCCIVGRWIPCNQNHILVIIPSKMLFNNFNRLFELLKFFSSNLSFDVVKEVYTMLLASFRFSFSLRLMHFSQTKKYICFEREREKKTSTTEFSTLSYYIHTNLTNFFMLFYICCGCSSKMF